MAKKIYSTVKLYSNFPINSYFNQFYHKDRETRNKMFDSYCNVKIDGHDKGQVEGVNYFEKLATIDLSNLTFRLKIQNPSYTTSAYRTAMDYNYGVLIQEGKRYYFFIDDIEWSSNVVTATFHCTCDWWQTYCYDIDFEKSFIERQHVDNDTFGKHILDENLPISEYIVNRHEEISVDTSPTYVCLVLSDNTYAFVNNDPEEHLKLYYKYGLGYRLLTVAFPNTKEGKESLQKTIDLYVSNNKIDSIQGLYVASCPIPDLAPPTAMFFDDGKISEGYVLKDTPMYNGYLSASVRNKLNGYQPKNNKTKCFPYSFVNITNYLGNSITAKYEFSKNNTIKFYYNFPDLQGACGNGYLQDYDGINGENLDYSLNSITNIELPWVTNSFSAYLSANMNRLNASINIADRKYDVTMKNTYADVISQTLQQTVSSISAIKNGVAEGMMHGAKYTGSAGAMIGGVQGGATQFSKQSSNMMNSTIDSIAKIYKAENSAAMSRENTYDTINSTLRDMQTKGNIAHGSFIPNMLTDTNKVGFQLQEMTITAECAETIDHYFSMFGYKVNRIAVPDFECRANWNYIKTSGVNIISNIPQVALNAIKDMFNNGTTIWHNLKGMYKYGTFDNPIV